jgi:hypothetical protein
LKVTPYQMAFIHKEHSQASRLDLVSIACQEPLDFGFFAATAWASAFGLTLLVFFQLMSAAANKS